ncbi:MAG: restriction endonuclease subunit S [Bacteroidales bacterium]|nr:restriction endonuclease subunit S [Bacteroidales bacterium]
MDTKKLRQKILDLAIRGKLVPQDPNDEPASLLLERIRAEKERLIKEGKIKRSKKTADNARFNNINFVIPPNWALSTLAEVFYMHAGKSISASQISSKKVDKFSYQCIGGNGTRGYVKTYNTQGIHPIIGRQGALCGNINYASGHFYATEHAVVVDTFCNTSERWVYYILINLNLNQYATATAQPGLSVNTIGDVQIPIPPINEQKRIVEAIERWFTLIDELENNEDDLLKAIDKAKSKILDLAIHGKLVPQNPNDEPAIGLLKRINPKFEPCDNEDYPTIPSHWQLCSVKDVFLINPKTNASDNLDAAFIPMSSIEDQYNNKFEFESRKWGEIKRGYTHFQDGDIAVAKISPCLENRKSVVLKDLPNGIGAGTTELNVFRSEIVNPIYGLIFFKSNYFISKCVGTFNGVVGQQRVATKLIEDIDFPLPPLAEQERIVAKIEEIFKALDALS